MRSCAAMFWLRSTSTLAIRTAPPARVTAASSAGPSVLHGPHHAAQKSTITGTVCDASITSVMKSASVTSRTRSPAAGPFAVLPSSSISCSPLSDCPLYEDAPATVKEQSRIRRPAQGGFPTRQTRLTPVMPLATETIPALQRLLRFSAVFGCLIPALCHQRIAYCIFPEHRVKAENRLLCRPREATIHQSARRSGYVGARGCVTMAVTHDIFTDEL